MADINKPCSSDSWQKHGAAFESYFSDFFVNFPSSVEYLGDGKFRIWIAINEEPFRIGYAEGTPGKDMRVVIAKLSAGKTEESDLSISNLPRGWNPTQPINIRLDYNRHRLYFWAHGHEDGVVRFLAAESYDGRNYTVLDPNRPCLYHVNDRAAVKSDYSATLGLTPTLKQLKSRPANEPAADETLICNDATTVYRLGADNWVLYSASLVKVGEDDSRYVAHDNVPGWIRVIDRWESTDGLNWTNRKCVIQADDEDPVDQQFYHLAMCPTEKGYIGLLGNYKCQSQTMDVEWCYSQDSISWQRPARRAWIKRGSDGSDDCYAIYPSCPGVIFAENKWWMFYTGINFAHNGSDLRGNKKRTRIMYATTDSIWDV